MARGRAPSYLRRRDGRRDVKLLLSLMALAGSVAFLVQDLTVRALDYL